MKLVLLLKPHKVAISVMLFPVERMYSIDRFTRTLAMYANGDTPLHFLKDVEKYEGLDN